MSTGRLGAGDTAIQPTIFDAKGDLLTATAGDTPARIAVGSNGQYLKADSTTATGLAWATLPSSGKVLQVVSATTTTATTIASTTLTDTGITATITPTLSTSKVLVLISAQSRINRANDSIQAGAKLLRGATQIGLWGATGTTDWQGMYVAAATEVELVNNQSIVYLDSPATTSATTYKLQSAVNSTGSGGVVVFQRNSAPSTITLLEIGA